tara:strand:+ start:17149 stop:19968 length:2820 start_codon:yes stop_codon:yes gene_type:complete
MKFLKILAATLSLLLILILVLPFAFSGKITELAKKEINESVNAKVDFSDISLSLIRNFPDFSLRLGDLSVLGNAPFEDDTLFYTQNLDITIDLMSVLKGSQYVIKDIEVGKPLIQLITLDSGLTNWEIIPASDNSDATEDESTDAEPYKIMLKSFTILEGRVVYKDQSSPFQLSMNNINTTLAGDFTLDQTQMKAVLEIGDISSVYNEMTLMKSLSLKTDVSIDANLAENIFDLDIEKLLLNSLQLSMGGRFSLADSSIGIDFKFDAPQGTFKQLLSLIPAEYLNNYSDLNTTGNFSFNAFAKGNFNETEFPAFGAELKVDQATIASPELPEKLENIQLALFVDNKTGDFDHTLVEVRPLRFSMKDNPFELNLTVKTPVSDPEIDATLKGKLLLEEVAALLPDAEIPVISGIVALDMALKTKLSSIEQEKFEQIDASGSAILTEFKTQIEDENLAIQKVDLKFAPTAINTNVQKLTLGKSDFNFSGNVQNYLGYFLSDGVLKGQFKLTSSNVDVNELMQFVSSDTSDTTTIDLSLADRMDLQFISTIQQLTYEQYELKEVRADIGIVDNKIQLNPLQAKLFGGEVRMLGIIDVIDKKSPLFNFDFKISKFDIPSAYQTIQLFQAAAPIAEHTTGKFSVDFNLKGRIDEQLEPVFSTLQGGGELFTTKVEVDSAPALNKLSSLLGNEDYRKLTTNGVDIGFEFVNGRVYQKPFGLNFSGSDATVSGSLGFDQSLDYDLLLNVPYGKLGKEVSDGIVSLVNKIGGSKANLKPETNVQIKAKISGLVTNPKISLDYKDYANDVKADLNRLAQQEIEKQKAALAEKAKAEAQKALEAARKQGDSLIEKADATAKTIRDEATKAATKLREEADKRAEQLIVEGKKKGMIGERFATEAAKKIREEADKKASLLEREADQKASKLQAEAKTKADALIKEAERKAGN